MAGNKGLHEANRAKKDEFYTRIEDIANELKHYKDHFKDKVVLCNCDDPYESNFFKYFALNFNYFGLKKLICTCWDGSPISNKELNLFKEEPTEDGRSHIAYKVELTEVKDITGDGASGLEDVKAFLLENPPTRLKGNGDFRSQECIELLKEADIVVTNPPFSLFREYVAQLVKYEKKFIIIGHQNAITYKEIFPLIKENKMWLGYGFRGGASHFISHYEDTAKASDHKEGMIRVSGVVWFTNLDTNKRHYPLDLYKHYTPEEYPKYDNYDAINVDKTSNIPMDYDGVMGVPISFLDKYCPEQFEILELGNSRENFTPNKDYINPIKHLKDGKVANGGAINCVLALSSKEEPKGQVYYTSDNSDYLIPPYARILIRKKTITYGREQEFTRGK